MITLNPGNIAVLSVRALLPFRGVPIFDLELDPDVVATVPSSGKVAITIGTLPGPATSLVGTIDPRGSGPFATLYSMRVLGGGAGWDQPVAPQHYQHDGGVPNQEVYSTTATLVGEVALVLVPAFLGTDFVRTAGPASRVLDPEPSWWVDAATGITTIGPRPPALPDPSLALTFWDAKQQRAELVSDALLMPGTPIVDVRIGASPVVVRDVEQVFDAHGSKVTAWCGESAATQLANDLRAMVGEFSGIKFARTYLYRIILQSADGRLALQAVHAHAGVPDMIPIAPWSGVAGASANCAGFAGRDRSAHVRRG